jgi:hypothetical protein
VADSWGNFLYEPHAVVAMSPLNSESSIKLLDVLIMDAILIYFVLVFVIAEVMKLVTKRSLHRTEGSQISSTLSSLSLQ